MINGRKRIVMCQACRGLIDSSARTCPLCGRDSIQQALPSAESPHFFSRLILTINLVLFTLMVLVGARSKGGVESIISGPSSGVFLDFGGRYPSAIAHGQWWRIITANFLHIGIVHMFFNSLVLYQIGPHVEEAFGSQKFIFLYLAAGIISNVAASLFGIYGAGASGAIFALLGAMAVYGYRMGGVQGRILMRQMLVWAAVGILIGFVPGLNLDNVSHISGFAVGCGLAFILRLESPSTDRAVKVWNATAIACAALIALSFAMVGFNYGKMQRGGEVIVLSRRLARVESALTRAFNWKDKAGGDPKQIAQELRSSASDVERLASIDAHSDQIRHRLADLARKRASLLEASEGNPAAAQGDIRSDRAEMEEIIQDFNTWVEGIKDEYGLVYGR
jgi:rhomboid protease GluP